MIFDIGANIGDESMRVGDSFWGIERPWCRHYPIVLVEPNPILCDLLRQRFSELGSVIEQVAVTGDNGAAVFHVARGNHVLSSLRREWLEDPRFRFGHVGVSERITVESMTIDALVERHGKPVFIKIDIEGGEKLAITNGLNNYYSPISFEWTIELLDDAVAILSHLAHIGYHEYHLSVCSDQNTPDGGAVLLTLDECVDTLRDVCRVYNKGNVIPAQPTRPWGQIFCR